MSNEQVDRIRNRALERQSSGQIGGVQEWFEIDFLLAYIDQQERELRDARSDNEELQEFQNTIASRVPERYEDDVAQEAIIDRWLDDVTKPRTITSAEDLLAMPEGSVVLDVDNDVSQKRGGLWCGYETNPLNSNRLARTCAPFTVLYEPEAQS